MSIIFRALARLFRRTPRPSPVVPHTPLGLVAHRCDDAEVGALVSLGVRHVRVTFYVGADEGDPTYRTTFGARLEALRLNGIAPLVVVHDLRGGEIQVAHTMADLAASFPGTTWQVGNEWDGDANHPWARGDAYAGLMNIVAYNVRRMDPTARFVSLGLASPGSDTQRHGAFVRDYIAAGGPALDAWCVHAYGVPAVDAFRAVTSRMRAALPDKTPLWVTEFGVEGNQLREAYGALTTENIDAVQAGSWSSILTAAPSCNVQRLYGYALRLDDNGNDDGHGILRADGSERPACAVVRTYNKGRA